MIDRVISLWPVTVGDLTFRSPVEADIPPLLAVRSLPEGTEGLIGYIVDPAEWGRGIATATVLALLWAAVEVLGLRRVTAGANLDNSASVRALERADMRRKPHEVQALWHAELGWLDEVGYAMLADEWRARS